MEGGRLTPIPPPLREKERLENTRREAAWGGNKGLTKRRRRKGEMELISFSNVISFRESRLGAVANLDVFSSRLNHLCRRPESSSSSSSSVHPNFASLLNTPRAETQYERGRQLLYFRQQGNPFYCIHTLYRRDLNKQGGGGDRQCSPLCSCKARRSNPR